MSAKGIQQVLSRAMTDTAFAKALFVDAKRALNGYDLTTEELERFNELPFVEVGEIRLPVRFPAESRVTSKQECLQ